MNKKVTGIALAGTLALGGLGFGSHALANGTVELELDHERGVTQHTVNAVTISPEKAKEIALKERDGKVTDFELTRNYGHVMYEVDIAVNGDDEDVYVSAWSGKVLIDGKPWVPKQAIKVTRDQAIEAALNKTGGGTVTDTDIEVEHGRVFYDIEVRTSKGERNVYIDARSGKILAERPDYDRDDHDDDDDRDEENVNVNISKEQAKEAALNGKNNHVDDIELEYINGKWYYEVDVEDDGKDDIYVDANTGKVVNKSELYDVELSMQEAHKIALKKAPGTIVEASLDEDDGRGEYEFEIRANNGDEVEITIDAKTGSIIEFERDDD
ncbi:hypothetical protein G4V62_13480 [Bacillaceae bacterium SIJ1]|uniref:PepSY domain-containing protein n=1 Tax=Litoribacterium kuwaitense TaxID=1398745 RepID=UPI0013EDC850|nr:PepSY domain-containing protein [Litoribacterium kuwaitense]NGP45908.1 hypothetical protein [Litoribacterium kuwaitense]